MSYEEPAKPVAQPAYGAVPTQAGYVDGIPVPSAVPVGPISQWASGPFQCFDDISSCCDGYFCAVCQIGYQYNMVKKGTVDMDVMACMLTYLIGVPCGAMYMRSEIRKVFNIEGTSLEDVVLGICCSHCVVCQNYRELSLRGHWCSGVCVSAPYVSQAPQPRVMGGSESDPLKASN